MQRPVVDDHAVIEETIEQCVLADRMGFDTVWFVEHHFLTSFSMSPCPEVIFGALSRLTKRIRLGFGVVILPYHHPVRVAERVAMVDHLSGGRVEFGTGRSAAYEQIGMGIDPRNTRAMWEESLAHDPARSGRTASSRGRGSSGTCRRATCAPSPTRSRTRAIWVAALQPATYQLAAEKGIGVMALSVAAPSYLAPHIKAVQGARAPRQAGGEVHQRPVAELDHGPLRRRTTRRRASWPRNRCGRSSGPIARTSRTRRTSTSSSSSRGAACRSTCRRTSPATSRRKATDGRARGRSLRRLRADRRRRCGTRSTPTRWSIAASSWPAIPRAVCASIAIHEEAGVDELQFLMATETVPHDKVMTSIEMFGKHVIPELRKQQPAHRS